MRTGRVRMPMATLMRPCMCMALLVVTGMDMVMGTVMGTPRAPTIKAVTITARVAPTDSWRSTVSNHAHTLLKLMWLASPALPVGGFSYSEGLEAAVDAGQVCDEDSAARWLHEQLHLVVQRAEWPVMARAHAAFMAQDEAAARAANDWVLQTRESRELRLQTEQMGRSLTDWLRQRHPDSPMGHALKSWSPAATWPVAFALAGALSGAPVRDVLLAHGFGWAENQVQAAIKCIPLGQSAGQRVLQALSDALPDAVDTALAATMNTAQAYTPGLAILSARHEDQYSRLFRS